jgi:hypothetical protein
MGLFILIGALKVVSAATSGVLGICGIFGKYTNRSGALTPNGRLMVTAIACSTVIAVLASAGESYKAKLDAAQEADRARKTLTDLNRNLQPITMLRLTYFVEFPKNNPMVKAYTAYLSKALDLKRMSAHQFDPTYSPPHDTNISASDVDGEPLDVTIGPESEYWPNNEFKDLGVVAETTLYSVIINRTPLRPDSFHFVHGGWNKLDMSAWGTPI